MNDKPDRLRNWSLVGTLGAAVAASVCCTLPVVLIGLGVGGAWLSGLQALVPFRPFLIGLSAGLLGFAFYKRCRQCNLAWPADASRRTKHLLPTMALGVVGLVGAPWLIASMTSSSVTIMKSTPATVAKYISEMDSVVLDVDGMTCESCSIAIRIALGRLGGVEDAQVSLDPPQVLVGFDPSRVTPDEIMSTLRDAGYGARIAVDQRIASPHITAKALGRAHDAPALKTIEVDQLRNAFNRGKNDVRIVAVVSPTCEICVKGYEIVGSVFEQYDTSRLKGMVVWLPMLAGDNAASAQNQVDEIKDNRIVLQGWDDDRAIGNLFAETLDLKGTAWDIYLVYGAGTVWKGDRPPQPDYWMHQLDARSGADQQYCLNPAEFSRQVGNILERTTH